MLFRSARAAGPRFRLLSKQASDCFAADLAPAAQIERIYHLLCADPEAGASGLETLNRQWSSSAYPEDRYALAAVLKELEDSQLLAGRARAWAPARRYRRKEPFIELDAPVS